MPWCPKCRYEYRPEITRCPNCRVALVAEQPEAPPRVAGWRIDEQTERYLAPIRGGFANGLQTARQAFNLTFHARKLLIVVGVLVTLSSVGEMVSLHNYMSSLPNAAQLIQNIPVEHVPFTTRLLARFRNQSVPHLIIGSFAEPLSKPDRSYSYWIAAATQSKMIKYLNSSTLASGQLDWRPSLFIGIWGVSESLVSALISSLIMVCLVGWLFALAKGEEPRRWREYVEAYYMPILILNICLFEGTQLLLSGWSVLRESGLSYKPGLPLTSIGVLSVIIESIFTWVVPMVSLLLALAPFAIVGRNLGAWGGVKAGARILWQKGWTFLALLIGYRVVYEIIFMIIGSLPTLSRTVMFTNLPLYSVTGWVLNVALALLGLWLAMCFAILVLPKQEAVNS